MIAKVSNKVSMSQYPPQRRNKGLQARARAEGKQIGRPSKLNETLISSVEDLRTKKTPIKKIAKELNIGIGTVYKILNQKSA